MALGTCPECDHSVASSASSCPNCGNTEFYVKTGYRIRYLCSGCKGSGKKNGNTCRSCDGTGLSYYDQTYDSRNPSELSKRLREAKENERTKSQDLEKIRKAKIDYEIQFEQEKKAKREYERKAETKRAADSFKHGLLLAIVAYPIVGVGGCVVRLIAQGSPPHPMTAPAAHDAWMYSPFKSFTTEAIFIPILILVFAIFSAMKSE
jgi:hypothetical protein